MVLKPTSLTYEDNVLLSKDEIPPSAKLIVLQSAKISIASIVIVAATIWMWGVIIHVLGSDIDPAHTLLPEEIE